MAVECSCEQGINNTYFLILGDFVSFNVTYYSKSLCNLLGSDKIGNLLEFMSYKDSRDLLEVTKKLKSRFDFKCVLVTSDNTFVSAVLKFVIIGSTIYCYVTECNKDEGYVKRLEFEYDRASALIEMTGCLLAEFNSEGYLTYATSSFINKFNVETLQKGVVSALREGLIFRKDFLKVARLIRSNYLVDKIYEEELRLKVNSGYLWFRCATKGLVDARGSVDRVIVKLEDINIYKVNEKVLKLRAETDELTRCYKKDFLLSELGRTKLTKGFLAFFDIDNFKGINDTYGHLEGDNSLRQVAKLCNEIFCGDRDIVCRFGGDEFCVFSGDSTRESFEHKIRTLSSRIQKLVVCNIRPLSISVGIAVASKSINTIDAMLNVADSTLYIVKNNGKNSYKFCDDL